MCGISGLVCIDRQSRIEEGILQAMAGKLHSRGPDEEGFFMTGGVGFAHRRLKVVDLVSGQQPMTDPSGMVTLVYNGEIYNFRELRVVLTDEGYDFSTNSDTEVLLLGYMHWGIDVLKRISGMFAFAIWDERLQSLILARDRMGQKPLYWAQLPDHGIIFASELTAILASGLLPKEINSIALARYLSYGYVLGSESIIDDLKRLPPSSYLRWQRGRDPEIQTYWNLIEVWSSTPCELRSPNELVEEFSTHIHSAVQARLISDVPLGAFLSGGLDSSVIVACMRKYLTQVKTYSIGFSEISYDETPWASRVAEYLGCNHVEKYLDGIGPDLLSKIINRLDEPFADTSILPTYILCEVARQYVTVALSGDGGDELLAGYITHLANSLHSSFQYIPKPLAKACGYIIQSLPDSRRKISFIFKAKQFMRGIVLDPCDAHSWWRTLIDHQKLGFLLGKSDSDISEITLSPFREAFDEAKNLSDLDRALYVDYKTWLPDDILFKVDRASMAHGLEVRNPFLDHHLIEFCLGLSANMKFRRGRGKYILRLFAKDMIPDFVIKRKKQGFNAPVSHWLVGPWRELCEDLFSIKNVDSSGLLDSQIVQDIWKEHLDNKRDHGFLLFSLLVLLLWLQTVQSRCYV